MVPCIYPLFHSARGRKFLNDIAMSGAVEAIDKPLLHQC